MGAHNLTGTTLLQNGVYSKGTAFSEEERAALHLKGLLPPVPATISMQVEAMMEQLRAFDTPFQKALFLDGLRSSNETLYFRLLLEHIEEVLPLVYTPLREGPLPVYRRQGPRERNPRESSAGSGRHDRRD